MFEQSVVEARALTARPWTLAVSVMGQAVIVTAAVVLPMLHPDTLKRVVMLAAPIGGPPPAYRPPVTQTVQPARPAIASPRAFKCTFCAPTRIPDRIEMVTDEPGPGVVGVAGDPGIQGVVGGFGVPGGDGVGRILDPPPPARPQPVQQVRQVVREALPPAQPTQVRRGGEVQASLLVYRPEPIYPPLAKQARVSGTVRLSAIISTDGKIAQLRVMSGHPLLVASAMDAVKRWVYSPTLLNGVPVEVITEVTVTFTLN